MPGLAEGEPYLNNARIGFNADKKIDSYIIYKKIHGSALPSEQGGEAAGREAGARGGTGPKSAL